MNTAEWRPLEPHQAIPWMADADLSKFREEWDGEVHAEELWICRNVSLPDSVLCCNQVPTESLKGMMEAGLSSDHAAATNYVLHFYERCTHIALKDVNGEFFISVDIQVEVDMWHEVNILRSHSIVMAGVAGLGMLIRLGFVSVGSFMPLAVYSHFIIALIAGVAPDDAVLLEQFMLAEYPIFADTNRDSILNYCRNQGGVVSYINHYQGYIPASMLNAEGVIMEFFL